MKFEKEKISGFYRRLISLYPQKFRERFGESMEQTFNDVCNERKGNISLSFVISTFCETSVGVVRENLLALRGADQMNYWFKTVGIAALFSLLLTGAFWIAALLMNPGVPGEVQSEGASLPLGILFNWLVLTLIFTPVVSGLRHGENMSIKDFLFPLGGAGLFGLLMIAPFAFMEYWNNPVIYNGQLPFPYLLFFALWIPPTLFFLIATPIVRQVRAGESVLAHPVSLLLRGLFLLYLAIFWVRWILGEMPCLLGGVPNCD